MILHQRRFEISGRPLCLLAMFIGVAIGGYTPPAKAVPEKDYDLRMADSVLPFCQNPSALGQFVSPDGLNHRYLRFRNPSAKDAIMIAPGSSEPMQKHCELAYDLYQLGYSVYLIEERGQGMSPRLLPDPQKHYVRHFDDYVRDFHQLLTDVVRPDAPARVFAVGHSMGGAVVARHLELYPSAIDRAVLSVPMLEINTAPFPAFAARLSVGLLTGLGLGRHYGPGQGPATPQEWNFADLHWTHSEARFLTFKRLFVDHPELVVWGATNRFVREALSVTRKIRRHSDEVQTPVLLFQAGLDEMVKPRGQDNFCARAANCRKVVVASAYHDLLEESDPIRDEVLREISAFLQ